MVAKQMALRKLLFQYCNGSSELHNLSTHFSGSLDLFAGLIDL